MLASLKKKLSGSKDEKKEGEMTTTQTQQQKQKDDRDKKSSSVAKPAEKFSPDSRKSAPAGGKNQTEWEKRGAMPTDVKKLQELLLAWEARVDAFTNPGEGKKSIIVTEGSPKVAIIYYTTYGHMKTMVDEVAKGLREAGCEVDLWQVPELLSDDVLKKMHAPEKPKDPVIHYHDLENLTNYDGFIFGVPTRFGTMPAQMKMFMDSTGGLWFGGKLSGKPVSMVVGTGNVGAAESTFIGMFPFFAAHGMTYIHPGYIVPKTQMDHTLARGNSPYGAVYLAGADGSRWVSKEELEVGFEQGKHCGTVMKAMYMAGKEHEEVQIRAHSLGLSEEAKLRMMENVMDDEKID